jgi:23S rRNA pseudouridine2605 synthase
METPKPKERLQKILAARGVASRREAESFITGGRVKVNGIVVTTLGFKADPDTDEISVDDRPLAPPQAPRVIMLHKPTGFLSTCRKSREEGREILELIPHDRRYFPVGRLDRESSGLILLTDDGDLAFRLTHPSRHVPKIYLVDLNYPLTRQEQLELLRGMEIEDGFARIDAIEQCGRNRYYMTLHEGRKRQIRRMVAELHLHVRVLHRVQIGSLHIGDLPIGQWRELGPQEIRQLLT